MILTLIISTSLAKYKVTESIKIVSGTINYSPGDIIITAYLNNVKMATIPNKNDNYVIENITCDKSASATWDNDIWGIKVSNLTKKGTKCDLYFVEYTMTASDIILANKTIKTRTNFNVTVTDETTGVIYQASDEDGPSYYFAGAPKDNYVKFGKWASNTPDVYYGYNDYGMNEFSSLSECDKSYTNCTLNSRAGKDMYWRIIRINGDGTIRLIYDGTIAHENGIKDGDRSIQRSSFNSNLDSNEYVGYMYTMGNNHGSESSSIIKGVLDTWYTNNLSSYSNYIDRSAGFCNDRSAYTNSSGTTSGGGTGTTETYYGALVRLETNKSPILTCPNSLDLFTTTTSNKGNKKLTNPIGLITADEVSFAGGLNSNSSITNKNYYLYVGYTYNTISPARGTGAIIWSIDYEGKLINSYLVFTSQSYSVRPVINLRADVKLSGSGTSGSPYIVIGAN